MKKSKLFTCLLLLTAALQAAGQDIPQRVPVITLGRIKTTDYKNGKPLPAATTRTQILKNSMLIADLNNCRVTEYKFSMIAPNRGFYGPVYVEGAELPDSLKTVLKNTPGPGVKLYFEEVKMLYRGSTMSANPVYLQYDE